MPDETMRDATSDETKLAPPWVTWAREVTALFEHDEEVTVEIDEDAPSVAIRVTNAIKADALAQIVPTEMQFGNVTLDVAVIPANSDATDEQVWRWAFDGNPALACTETWRRCQTARPSRSRCSRPSARSGSPTTSATR